MALVIGAAGSSEFVLRYLLPAAPLLLAGGAVGAARLREKHEGIEPRRAV